MYDLVLKGGKVIDPAQGISGRRDVAVRRGKIAAVAEDIPAEQAKKVLDATGKIVTPGIIDMHTHVFWGVSHFGLDPDSTCLAKGVTTVLDAGCAGAQTFPAFRRFIIEKCKTRIYALLNISAAGQVCGAVGELEDIRVADPDFAVRVADANRDVVLGIKVRLSTTCVGTNGIEPLRRARQAADALKMPVMVHFGTTDPSVKEILDLLRPGDILTHCFHGRTEGILDEGGKLLPEVREARERGVIFDVAHGRQSFRWEVARRALDQGCSPFTISSDLHTQSINGPVYDQLTTMSKFLVLGFPLEEVIRMSTINPATALGLADRHGTLHVGREADLSVLELAEGDFPLEDCHGEVCVAKQKLVAVATVRAGKVR